MPNKLFKKYRSRLTAEAFIKALLIGASAGFGVAALTGLMSWFFGFKAGLWLAIGLFVAVTAVLTAVLYVKKFRPTTKMIARRVDELGLEERVITMTELEGQDTYIAQAQREDTMAALGGVSYLLLNIAISASMIVAVVLSGVAFAGLVTVDSLYTADVIPSGMDLVLGDPGETVYTVDYSVTRGTEGQIVYYTDDWDNGQSFDHAITVYVGEDAPAVLAVPAEGWAFSKWSDGQTNPFRQDLAVGGSINVTATFIRVAEDADEDAKPEEDHIELPFDGEDGPPPQDPNDHERTKSSTQVEDGKTYYGDNYGETTQESMGDAQSNNNIPGDMQGYISDYFDALSPGQGESEGEGEDGGGN